MTKIDLSHLFEKSGDVYVVFLFFAIELSFLYCRITSDFVETYCCLIISI